RARPRARPARESNPGRGPVGDVRAHDHKGAFGGAARNLLSPLTKIDEPQLDHRQWRVRVGDGCAERLVEYRLELFPGPGMTVAIRRECMVGLALVEDAGDTARGCMA